MNTPKQLKVIPRRDTPDHYTALIKKEAIGNVEKRKNRDGTFFEFTSSRDDMPEPFKCRRMKEIREELTRRIPRDQYLAILEAQPE
jgi:hypothetical protein